MSYILSDEPFLKCRVLMTKYLPAVATGFCDTVHGQFWPELRSPCRWATFSEHTHPGAFLPCKKRFWTNRMFFVCIAIFLLYLSEEQSIENVMAANCDRCAPGSVKQVRVSRVIVFDCYKHEIHPVAARIGGSKHSGVENFMTCTSVHAWIMYIYTMNCRPATSWRETRSDALNA